MEPLPNLRPEHLAASAACNSNCLQQAHLQPTTRCISCRTEVQRAAHRATPVQEQPSHFHQGAMAVLRGRSILGAVLMLGLALLGLIMSSLTFSVGSKGSEGRHQRDILSLPSQSRSLKISASSAAAPASVQMQPPSFYNLSKRFGPDALLEAPMLGQGIPKIIHQSWKTSQVPELYHAWVSTWLQNHPTWLYKLWTDDENREFIARHYPWFLRDFDNFTKPIIRADAARIFYMYHYGGVYVDLDFESLRPLDALLDKRDIALAQMGKRNFSHNVPNAFMASSRGHDFWYFCVRQMLVRVAKAQMETYEGEWWDHVEQTAGPAMLHAALQDWNYTFGKPLPLIAPDLLYPYDWSLTWEDDKKKRLDECHYNSGRFDEHACKKHFKKAYAITYWMHTWEPQNATSSQSEDQVSLDAKSHDDGGLEEEYRR
ncbi:hypothetical protein WJX74_010888 [Apatococcus lobatus]|uniref:Uncharacterized protein n=1 Tax=Apatococcus lobatus TaxID=904363 RepID=A0AAW1S606_9CHLO